MKDKCKRFLGSDTVQCWWFIGILLISPLVVFIEWINKKLD
jgi:hypothetical protein